MNRIIAVYIEVGKEKAPAVIEFNDDLDEIKRLINCDAIDVVHRKIAGKNYVVICDDEGLLKSNPIPSVVYYDKTGALRPNVFGNVIICADQGEDIKSLNKNEISDILYSIVPYKMQGKLEHAVVFE